jgi:hypothetical protein
MTAKLIPWIDLLGPACVKDEIIGISAEKCRKFEEVFDVFVALKLKCMEGHLGCLLDCVVGPVQLQDTDETSLSKSHLRLRNHQDSRSLPS